MKKISEYPRSVALFLLRGYKWVVSPMLPPACRYVPTCSEYAAEAVDHYGVFQGGAMAVWRLLRCHPFAKGGYDPVVRRTPEREIDASKDVPALSGRTLRATER